VVSSTDPVFRSGQGDGGGEDGVGPRDGVPGTLWGTPGGALVAQPFDGGESCGMERSMLARVTPLSEQLPAVGVAQNCPVPWNPVKVPSSTVKRTVPLNVSVWAASMLICELDPSDQMAVAVPDPAVPGSGRQFVAGNVTERFL
jgi:hypothetical protein